MSRNSTQLCLFLVLGATVIFFIAMSQQSFRHTILHIKQAGKSDIRPSLDISPIPAVNDSSVRNSSSLSFSNTNGSVDTPELHSVFPSRTQESIAKQLAAMENLWEPLLQDLEKRRTELLAGQLHWQKPHNSIVDVANGYRQDYFSVIAKYQTRVDTFFASAKVDTVYSAVTPHYYDYTSTDCGLLENKSIYGKQWGKQNYNASCHNLMTESFPVPRNPSVLAFQTYLPQNFTVGTEKLTLGFIHIIRSAAVKSTGDIFVDKLKIVPQHCSQDNSKQAQSSVHHEIYDEIFSVAQFWGSGFYHGMCEQLLRIAPYVPFLNKHQEIKIHVEKANGFTKAALAAIGLQVNRLISGPISAKLLYVPMGGTCGRSALPNAQLMSLRYRKSIPTVEKRQSIVIIKRSTKRYWRQHDNIMKMLKQIAEKYGLTVELFGDNPGPSFNQAMAMFNRAVMVVGPHGAGFSNLLFSEPRTVVIEGLCFDDTSRYNLCYRNLAQVLGQRYHGIDLTSNCFDTTPDQVKQPVERIITTLLS